MIQEHMGDGTWVGKLGVWKGVFVLLGAAHLHKDSHRLQD
jgi:hypothetical protein